MDTGVEFPEAKIYSFKLVELLGLSEKLHVTQPRHTFWEYLELFGIPHREYRWCCKVLKFAPVAEYIGRNFSKGTVTLTGKRKYESKRRQIERKVESNRWLQGQILVNPIRDWSSLHVGLYLFHERIPINPIYEMGFDRLSFTTIIQKASKLSAILGKEV